MTAEEFNIMILVEITNTCCNTKAHNLFGPRVAVYYF